VATVPIMNWRATGWVLVTMGTIAALGGWWWSTSIHEERHSCRLRNLAGLGDECPSKAPAIGMAVVGGVLIVFGLAVLVGAVAGSGDRQRA